MEDSRLNILPPWLTFKKIKELFKDDPQIIIEENYDSNNPSVDIYTNNPEKVTALLKGIGGVKLITSVD